MVVDLAKDIVLRWEDSDPEIAPLLREGGVDVVLTRDPAPAFSTACEQAGMRSGPLSTLTVCSMDAFGRASGAAALSDGLWPGATGRNQPAEADEIASPSRIPWIDANGFRIDCLKALFPDKTPSLAYLPNEAAGVKPTRVVPYRTLELALLEAWIHGGNYVLAVEPRYRAALIRRDEKALEAWRRLGETVRWLRQYRPLLGLPSFPEITLLVDGSESTLEIANLMARHSVSPAIEPADAPPPPDPAKRLEIVAVSLAAAMPSARDRILAHADAGAIVVTDRGEGEPWWRVNGLTLLRDEPDRETFQLGKGKVVAYKSIIQDPSDFALDTIDLITHARRSVRIWSAPSVVATVTRGPSAGEVRGSAVLRIINYGSMYHFDLLAYVQGNYKSAVLYRPGAAPVRLKATKRKNSTEVLMPGIERAGLVVLE